MCPVFSLAVARLNITITVDMMMLVGLLVGWLDSGAPSFMICHHSLIQY